MPCEYVYFIKENNVRSSEASSNWHGAHYSWNSWKTLGETDNFPIFLDNSLNFVEFFFYQFYKQSRTCRSTKLVIVPFVFYLNTISVAATVAKITWFHFVFTVREFGIGSWNNRFFTLKNSWNFVILSQWASWNECVDFLS